MGIYDTIFSTFDLGPGFWNRELEQKISMVICHITGSILKAIYGP